MRLAGVPSLVVGHWQWRPLAGCGDRVRVSGPLRERALLLPRLELLHKGGVLRLDIGAAGADPLAAEVEGAEAASELRLPLVDDHGHASLCEPPRGGDARDAAADDADRRTAGAHIGRARAADGRESHAARRCVEERERKERELSEHGSCVQPTVTTRKL
eukprot:6234878-Prymnesium_polylepis.1